MLHLVPIRYALMAIFLLVAATVLLAVYAGVIGTGDALADTKWAIRWMTTAALVLAIVPQLLWRWIPSVQNFIFPYLGGHWRGTIDFEGKNGQGTRDVSLTINHSLIGITLILDSEESTSRTLTAQADRDTGINRDRLYYVYLNERKEGTTGAGDRYRGLAVLRIEKSSRLELLGDYFTERQSNGKIHLKIVHHHQWWNILK